MPDSDHVAKFQGHRSRELGERVAKKTSAAEYKPVRNGGSGRPNNCKTYTHPPPIRLLPEAGCVNKRQRTKVVAARLAFG